MINKASDNESIFMKLNQTSVEDEKEAENKTKEDKKKEKNKEKKKEWRKKIRRGRNERTQEEREERPHLVPRTRLPSDLPGLPRYNAVCVP